MSKIEWSPIDKRIYWTGLDKGILFVKDDDWYQNGIPWNGLINIYEETSNFEFRSVYQDNIKIVTYAIGEDFNFSMEAYTYPDEFGYCDGTAHILEGICIPQQDRKPFSICYRTTICKSNRNGYKLHVIYNATAAVSEKVYNSIITDNVTTFSWDCETTPILCNGYKPTSWITVDSTKVLPANLEKLENILYGTDDTESRLPTIEEIIDILTTKERVYRVLINNRGQRLTSQHGKKITL